MPWLRWPVASLFTRRRRSLRGFSGVANDVCLWRRRSLRFARHMAASLIASLLLRRKLRVPMALSVPSLRSSHDDVSHYFASLVMRTARALAPLAPALRSSLIGVAHCVASLALQTMCACGAVASFASLVTWPRRAFLRVPCDANGACLGSVGPGAVLVTHRRRSLLCFSRITNGACLWRRQSLRFIRHMTAWLIAFLLLRH